METIYRYLSPIGCLEIKAEEKILTRLYLCKKNALSDNFISNHPIIQQTCIQLNEYFAKKRQSFELPLDIIKGTVFQKKVWEELQLIPYGKTISYLQLAQAIHCPNAYRAAGTATSKNPIIIIIPCHRVINTNGRLGGYTYGVKIKKQLLDLEQ
ncbi:MAG: methylated-DNA--[protein]-cysteine S-methyltransferase [Candidatus Azobacteroides pseudotrichonymphae]|uniref:methylated-DNA--[protein]-cysteine S-methyltransferase n=1 Tax=Azobacteroides pseudotrichonymphae genomovar. CFP2 TaxID=511995 RepID=B6YRR3_AZOPC|nr:methylated-DNA--[protein]-cysteine S-methyltransferase [Candidatus Azobacteroides pseudotrichonymphae]BAG83885.1 methylated-DNA-[protein]-cysteine S-methyltransferase [Candidatus Azobacteroides pseudotrichonymphae genomovar. CFP2]GMO33078.1 MAG: methylated-DNA--[protein]-cysteine S-methyltransferase [Candidatus Azobacteroides pseudotrichonymphae]